MVSLGHSQLTQWGIVIPYGIKKNLHVTHFLKLLDKMCKYEMDPASIVDGRTDKVKPVYPPFNFGEVEVW